METSFHEKILSQLNNITEDTILIVKCNDINERSAVNRLAYYRGCSTVAINSDEWKENFIFNYDVNYPNQYFSKIKWMYDDMDDYQYYRYYLDSDSDDSSCEGVIFYYFDKYERLEDYELSNDDDKIIIDLDYNAVAIYLNYMKSKYIDHHEFINRKNKIRKNNIKNKKGKFITTDIEEVKIINSIYEPEFCLCSSNDILKSYDTRNIILIKEIFNKYEIVSDITKILYFHYYSS